jgi:hypothetical protein
MTCIVGLVNGDQVIIGGDSAGVGGYDLTVRADQKVWAKDGWAFGFTTSFRMGQLLRYSLHVPKRHPDTDLMQFMVTEFVEAVRKCLKDGGYASTKDGAEEGGCFLVGHAGRLFRIDSDYQVGEAAAQYDAVGCGDSFAKGALYASVGAPAERVRLALKAAEAMSAGVRGPFHFVMA